MRRYIDKQKVLEYIIFGVVGKNITCGELKRAIERLPALEVDEDCISRKMVAKRLAELWETEHPEKSFYEWLEIANKWCEYFPPSAAPSRAEGDPIEYCIQRGGTNDIKKR